MKIADKLIIGFDQALRTVLAPANARRPTPGESASLHELPSDDKREAARLMRVNHSGEVCAQALYQGQSLTARNPEIQAALEVASREEVDHLAWCETRLHELGSRKSLLNPFWYGASFALGAFSGLMGDRWNLAFLVETERQVEGHLKSHLERLSVADYRTRAIVEQMKRDEASHAQTGLEYGAAELPLPIKFAMKLTSRVMTKTTYWV
ncbi:MAG TPA: 2-polyprenyl-3-methyl-6-methoxy-1,4-benzoquinone monooxygenase [Burkholderiales bacterium]|nr:2-polyprenyl-3-methyl-6-methoxy-1,4-benzoquinone monooxygenase [Burkholderiales bacterium]